MKKTLALILALVLMFAASAETFRMGFDAEYPPYSYMGDDGNYTGYDVEMCEKVCAILGWDMEYVPINWDTKLIGLDAGEYDCIWSGLTIDVLDDSQYSISFAYSDNSQMFLTRTDAGIKTFDDLKGKKTIGIKFRQEPGIKIVPSTGTLTIDADRYAEKTVQVNVRSINLPAHTTLRTFPSKVDVTFQVATSQYQDITEEAFDIVIDYNKLPKALVSGATGEKSAIKYVLALTDVPLGVRHARIVPDEVECIIEHDGE